MAPKGEAKKPPGRPLIRHQNNMAVVLKALALLAPVAVYLYGWRALALLIVVNLFAFLTEFYFTRRRGEQVTQAVFVTGTLLHASYGSFNTHKKSTSRGGTTGDGQNEWYAGIEQTIGRVYFQGSYFNRHFTVTKVKEKISYCKVLHGGSGIKKGMTVHPAE